MTCHLYWCLADEVVAQQALQDVTTGQAVMARLMESSKGMESVLTDEIRDKLLVNT